MNKVIRTVTLIMMVLVALLAWGSLYILVADEYAEYQAEGECISKYIIQGIERSDIKTSNGTCSVIGG